MMLIYAFRSFANAPNNVYARLKRKIYVFLHAAKYLVTNKRCIVDVFIVLSNDPKTPTLLVSENGGGMLHRSGNYLQFETQSHSIQFEFSSVILCEPQMYNFLFSTSCKLYFNVANISS
jgi:hypothetical protein